MLVMNPCSYALLAFFFFLPNDIVLGANGHFTALLFGFFFDSSFLFSSSKSLPPQPLPSSTAQASIFTFLFRYNECHYYYHRCCLILSRYLLEDPL